MMSQSPRLGRKTLQATIKLATLILCFPTSQEVLSIIAKLVPTSLGNSRSKVFHFPCYAHIATKAIQRHDVKPKMWVKDEDQVGVDDEVGLEAEA